MELSSLTTWVGFCSSQCEEAAWAVNTSPNDTLLQSSSPHVGTSNSESTNITELPTTIIDVIQNADRGDCNTSFDNRPRDIDPCQPVDHNSSSASQTVNALPVIRRQDNSQANTNSTYRIADLSGLGRHMLECGSLSSFLLPDYAGWKRLKTSLCKDKATLGQIKEFSKYEAVGGPGISHLATACIADTPPAVIWLLAKAS
ncbi:unnamed protein product [Protopolystoma xenopodis]|uniref:Uncharacterized protein n=1 Tax=Protopolystoma xenopodis TaxID=117903 RepID=A0A448XCJ1_9PLAT|nr:unnamed protein product [Protopolystoma xenopodis]